MAHLFEDMSSIQEIHGFLPQAELEKLALDRNIPLYSLQGVASFYPHFRLTAPKRLEIKVCRDFSCHLKNSVATLDALTTWAAGHGEVQVEEVSCLGRCESPTAVAFNDEIYTNADGVAATALATRALSAKLPPETRTPTAPFPGVASGTADGRFAVLKRVLAERNPDAVIATLKASNLRGMGGAGFPTGLKWELVRKAEGSPKYLVCNADESEPGTFKDRALLDAHAEQMVEGMIIGAFAVGASEGWVYIRHEYHREGAAVKQAITAARELQLLGNDIQGSGFSFTLELFESPGGYICGEETALLEAMEGKRAEPRNKPPFPGTHGLWGKPTVINNVETFSFVPAILCGGAEWWKSRGVNGSPGLKLLALSGHVRTPGVYEVPLGTTVQDFLDRSGGGVTGGTLKAFAPGGASSGFLPASLAHTPLDFSALAKLGSMLGSGAVVAVRDGTCMLDLAINVVRFFRDESCGKCVPCRIGSDKIVSLLTTTARGEGTEADLALIDEIAATMRETSICGLGQAAPYPITSVLKYWPDEVLDHIRRRHCPSGVCFPHGGRS